MTASDTKEQIKLFHSQGMGQRSIAKRLGVSRGCVRHHIKNEPKFEPEFIKPPKQVIKDDIYKIEMAEKIRNSDDRYSHLLKEHIALQKTHAAALSIVKEWLPVEPIKPRKNETGGESTALLIASDWHCEEEIDPNTVSGLNEYTVKIAKARAEAFWQHGLQLVEMARSKGKVDCLVVGLLGDFISGYIHEELVETNAMSPTQAIVFAGGLIESGLKMLLEHGKFKRIIAACCVGNHGRTTQRRRIATNIQNSYEWLLYYMLQRCLPEIEWQLPTGYHNLLTIYNTRVRLHHGESVRYQGGVGGMTIPLNKAIAQWNKAKHADLDILGHWHQRLSTREAIVNGSLIGYSPFAVEIKAPYEPPLQSFALIHPRYGKTVEAPIFVESV